VIRAIRATPVPIHADRPVTADPGIVDRLAAYSPCSRRARGAAEIAANDIGAIFTAIRPIAGIRAIATAIMAADRRPNVQPAAAETPTADAEAAAMISAAARRSTKETWCHVRRAPAARCLERPISLVERSGLDEATIIVNHKFPLPLGEG
jgi:hypothetical protein